MNQTRENTTQSVKRKRGRPPKQTVTEKALEPISAETESAISAGKPPTIPELSDPAGGECKEADKGEIFDSIEFTSGENSLKIRFWKLKSGRNFSLKFYLNEQEIRPATFIGYANASSYWGLLKNTLR